MLTYRYIDCHKIQSGLLLLSRDALSLILKRRGVQMKNYPHIIAHCS
jgi:hypothetical protein